MVTATQEKKVQLESELTTLRLSEMKAVVDSQDSAKDKENNLERVVSNIQQQLISDKEQLPTKSKPLAIKEVTARAEQVRKAIKEVKSSLSADISANMNDRLTAVNEIADKTSIQALEMRIAQNTEEMDLTEIDQICQGIIKDKEEAIAKLAAGTVEQADVADKLPINTIHAVLLNQTDEANSLVSKIKASLEEGDLEGALNALKAVDEIIRGAEKISNNPGIEVETAEQPNSSSSSAVFPNK
jgi:hypothetical protein